jgi:hypothetical protein
MTHSAEQYAASSSSGPGGSAAPGARGYDTRLGVRVFPTLLLIGAGRRVVSHSHARLREIAGALERALPR